jgi:hypothetical protein
MPMPPWTWMFSAAAREYASEQQDSARDEIDASF